MSRILGVLNYKGGTGKTTTVVNLAAGLALRGERVLCIDLDAQSNLATYLGVQPPHTLAHLILGEASLSACITPVRKNLDLIAGDRNLLQAEGSLWRMNSKTDPRQILIERLKDVDDYDFVILDYSPSASLLSESGLYYTQELIVPVSTSYLALVGVRQVIDTLKKIDRIPGQKLHLSMIVPTFYFERLRKDREVMATLNRYFADHVADPIRANIKLAEAPGHHASIYEYAPRSNGALDYARLVERIINNG
ncbi:MAG: ParA family protein [Chloroflexota bacterium]